MISNPTGFFGGGGSLAMLDDSFNLVANEQALVTNATSAYRHDEHVQYDAEMIGVSRSRMQITMLLNSLGLVKQLGGLGTILSMYQRSGDFTPANVSMSGVTRATQDSLVFDDTGVPIPIFHKEFYVDHRRLAMSRRMGYGIDTDMVSLATRVVAEEWERHLLLGTPSIVVGGLQAYGFTTHPDRNTLTLTATWVSTTGANIITDVNRMITAAHGDNFYGPYVIMVAKDIWLNLGNDYSATKGENTILDRIKAMPDIKDVVCADFLTAGNVILFQPTKDVVDLAVAQSMDSVPWQSMPFQTEYKVFTAGAIRVKSEMSGNSGVVHGTP